MKVVQHAPLYEEKPRPPIRRGCLVCNVNDKHIEQNLVIVSPAGIAHFGSYGDTVCGKDATGDNWWWPL